MCEDVSGGVVKVYERVYKDNMCVKKDDDKAYQRVFRIWRKSVCGCDVM